MKNILPVIIVFLVACGTANNNATEKTFPIPSYRAQKDVASDTTKHKAGDIEVFRIVGKDTTYFARFYRLDDGEVRQYETVIVQGTNYDKAGYEWINDSTVVFHLIDSKNNKRQSFQLTGSGASTSLKDMD